MCRASSRLRYLPLAIFFLYGPHAAFDIDSFDLQVDVSPALFGWFVRVKNIKQFFGVVREPISSGFVGGNGFSRRARRRDSFDGDRWVSTVEQNFRSDPNQQQWLTSEPKRQQARAVHTPHRATSYRAGRLALARPPVDAPARSTRLARVSASRAGRPALARPSRWPWRNPDSRAVVRATGAANGASLP